MREAAARLRAQSEARRLEVHTPPQLTAPVYQEPAPVQQHAPQAPVQQHYAPSPVAAAAGVQLQQVMPQPAQTYVEQPRAVAPEPERYDASPYIPPAPEAPMVRPQRMPQIEDLPVPVQNQIRQQYAAGDQGDVKRRTLLERLAAFGMSREDGVAPERPGMPQIGYQPSQQGYHAPQQAQPAQPSYQQRPQAPGPSASHADYAKRPQAPMPSHAPRAAQPSLDHHGRVAPPARSSEDDQLEIPAFLRRQTS